VPGDTWPTCSLSPDQLCLHDQVDLDTLTAELLAVVHQTVDPRRLALAAAAGRPPRTGSLAQQREPVWSRSGQPGARRDDPPPLAGYCRSGYEHPIAIGCSRRSRLPRETVGRPDRNGWSAALADDMADVLPCTGLP
jgi:hypothetical protein